MPSLNRLFNKSGYQRVGADDRRPNGSARGRTPDDENRLIDQLDEEVSHSVLLFSIAPTPVADHIRAVGRLKSAFSGRRFITTKGILACICLSLVDVGNVQCYRFSCIRR